MVFCHMGLDPGLRVAGREFTGTAQLRGAAGGRKTRRDGITQPPHPLPLLQQGFRIDQALLGGVGASRPGPV